MRRSVSLLALLIALTACSGDGDPGAEAGGPARSDASVEAQGPPAEPVRDPGEPRARLQAGTDSVEGGLVRLCERKDCAQPNRAPAGTLKVTDQRLMLFVLSLTPDSATVEVRRRGSSKVVDGGALMPSDLMAYEPSLRDGRYDVRLTVAWGERRAVWRFDVRVKDV